ncbi:MAG: GNAT family N-acetyltransferase [Chloroflexota bacterium]
MAARPFHGRTWAGEAGHFALEDVYLFRNLKDYFTSIMRLHQRQGMDNMILTATAADDLRIQDIAARTGVFSQEEVDCVGQLWQEYLTLGPQHCGYNFIVVRKEEEVVSFACYGPRDLTEGVFDLYWIAVDPSFHRNGVGRELLTATETAIREACGRMIIAETSGTPHYEPARKFYTSMGYSSEASITDFYKKGDDLVIFVKRL